MNIPCDVIITEDSVKFPEDACLCDRSATMFFHVKDGKEPAYFARCPNHGKELIRRLGAPEHITREEYVVGMVMES